MRHALVEERAKAQNEVAAITDENQMLKTQLEKVQFLDFSSDFVILKQSMNHRHLMNQKAPSASKYCR
jgi:hypothetical protein